MRLKVIIFSPKDQRPERDVVHQVCARDGLGEVRVFESAHGKNRHWANKCGTFELAGGEYIYLSYRGTLTLLLHQCFYESIVQNKKMALNVCARKKDGKKNYGWKKNQKDSMCSERVTRK